MAHLTQETNYVEGGFDKLIDDGAHQLIFDTLQQHQYMYPHKSTIREIVCNAVDAIREKQVAISILQNRAKAEDHYIEKEGALFKDSRWDPAYYDLNHLCSDDKVHITYRRRLSGKDQMIIKDFGVGLGPQRLFGYFKLGYSTKRLSKFGIGKFGLGNKSPLSTGEPFYTVESRYNGMLFRFNVYKYKVESIIPPFSEQGNNPMMVIGDSKMHINCHYETTQEPNGLTITVDTKKMHQQTYIDAAKSQLLYFDNVVFELEDEYGKITDIPLKANVLYEDDLILLSENNQYSKPHVLIHRVNYGYIDFGELELEQKMGNIGIKVAAEDVEVSSSRENIIWNEKTRATIVNRFKEVVNIAQHLVEDELKEPDFLKWVLACASTTNRFGHENNKSVVGRLSQIVDLKGLEMRYKPDPYFRYNNELFLGIPVRKVYWDTKIVASRKRKKIARDKISFTDIAASDLPIIVQKSRANYTKDRYMLETLYPDGFVSIKLTVYEDDTDEVDFSEIQKRLKLSEDDFTSRMDKLRHYIMESRAYTAYEDITVPDHISYKETEDEEDMEEEEEIEDKVEKAEVLSARQIRKQNGETILFTPRVSGTYGQRTEFQTYEWQKVTVPIKSISKWTEEEIFYSFSTEEEMKQVHLAALITRKYKNIAESTPLDKNFIPISGVKDVYDWQQTKCMHFFDNSHIKIIKIAKDNVKYYRDFKHITKFFADVKKNTITMSNALVRWNTARIVAEQLPKVRFLMNFRQFSFTHCESYKTLYRYAERHYRNIEDLAKGNDYWAVKGDDYKQLKEHCERIMELQLFVQQNPTADEAIGKLARNLFGTVTNGYGTPIEVTNGCAVDINIYNQLQALLEYGESVAPLLNEISVLTEDGSHIREDAEQAIKEYLAFKNISS